MKSEKKSTAFNWIVFSLLVASLLLGVISYSLVTDKTNQTSLMTARTFNSGRDLPEFKLVNYRNETVDNTSLQGQWHLMFFGYTHCPDVCPTSLAQMNQLYEIMQADPDQPALPEILFISVDPERDHSEQLKNYITYFNPDFMAATGEKDQIDTLSKKMGVVYYQGETDENGNYEVDHSATIMIISPDGKFKGLFPAPHHPESMAADLKVLMQS